MSHERVNQQTAATVLSEAVQKVVSTQQEAIAAGAAIIAKSVAAGGVIHVFGTGHSRSFHGGLLGLRHARWRAGDDHRHESPQMGQVGNIRDARLLAWRKTIPSAVTGSSLQRLLARR